jgi:peptidyl-prolyl cis-trans isomerase C
MFCRLRPSAFQLILILLLGLSACSTPFAPKSTPTPLEPTATPPPPTATPEPAAATVNGEIISVAEFRAEVSRYQSAQQALGKVVSAGDAEHAVREDLIAQTLLAQGARAAGHELSEADVQARIRALAASMGGTDQLSAWQAAHGYAAGSFAAALKRSAEAAWMRDQIAGEVAPSADQVQLQQILLYNAEAANQVLAQLSTGADFAELAARYDPVTHGELGWVPKGYLLDPQLEAAAFALQPGGHSDVIATEAGYHIVMVIARGDHPLSPDALLVLQEFALQAWLAQQRAQSAIQMAP